MYEHYLDPLQYPGLFRFTRVEPTRRYGVLVDCGWGDPCQFRAMCSCGWVGTDFNQYEGNGEFKDALRELLVHVGFDPVAEQASCDRQVGELLGRMSFLLANEVTPDGMDQVQDLAEEATLILTESAMLIAAAIG